MLNLTIAALAFAGGHFLISSTGLRARLVARLGERPYAGLYSAQALVLIVWLVFAFRSAPRDVLLWHLPGAAHLALIVMPLSLLLMVAGLMTPNPNAVMMAAPDGAWRAKGIHTVTRHPMMWAFGLWALLHIAATGDLAGLIFFGAFAVLALGGTLAIDAKKRRLWPAAGWRAFATATSNLPFLAVMQGRSRFDWQGIGWKPVAIAAALYAALVWWFHPSVLGTPVLPG